MSKFVVQPNAVIITFNLTRFNNPNSTQSALRASLHAANPGRISGRDISVTIAASGWQILQELLPPLSPLSAKLLSSRELLMRFPEARLRGERAREISELQSGGGSALQADSDRDNEN